MTIAEWYTRTKKIQDGRSLERNFWYVYYVVRPLAFLPTLILHRLRVSPNTVTWSGFAILMTSSLLFTVVPAAYYVLLAGLVNLYMLCDYVDGNLARLYRTVNQYGAFLDGSLAVIGEKVLMVCLGYAVYRDTMQVSGLLLGIYIVWLECIQEYLALRFDRDRRNGPVRASVPGGEVPRARRLGFNRVQKLYMYNVVVPIKFLSLVVFTWHNALFSYLLVYAIAITLISLPAIVITFIRARRQLNFSRPV